MTRRLPILWAPVALLLAYEFYLSSQSHLPSPPVTFSNVDKVVHAGYYFLVALFTYRAVRFGHGGSRGRAALVAILLAFLYGVSDEVHQLFTPLRDSDPWDVVADTTGAAIAAIVGERVWARFES